MSKSGSGEGNVLPFARRERSAGAEDGRTRRRRRPGSKSTTGNESLNSSSDWNYSRPFKPGEIVDCVVVGSEPGGYHVITEFGRINGYLPSTALFKCGDRVAASFICIDKHRLLLSARFTAKSRVQLGLVADWEGHVVFKNEGSTHTDDES